MELLESTLRLSTPLIFAALGGVLSERVGVVNIALEGMLLCGAFAAMAAASTAHNPWVGLAAAALCGLALALAHALLVLRLRVDAIISGVGINLFAVGITTFLLRSSFSKQGVGVQVSGLGGWFGGHDPMSRFLVDTPLVRTLSGARTPFVPLAFLAALAVWAIVYRTRPGLQLRAVGEAPGAARAAGVVVDRTRVIWLAVGGALAGMGGAYLSLEAVGRFTESMSAGKGYLALAAVIFGRWHPLGAAGAVLFFGFGEALQIALQGHTLAGVAVPSEFLSALPYVLGIMALAGALGRTKPPAGIGQYD